jgi:hypothetical protein
MLSGRLPWCQEISGLALLAQYLLLNVVNMPTTSRSLSGVLDPNLNASMDAPFT